LFSGSAGACHEGKCPLQFFKADYFSPDILKVFDRDILYRRGAHDLAVVGQFKKHPDLVEREAKFAATANKPKSLDMA
jgi:hypothetical protein